MSKPITILVSDHDARVVVRALGLVVSAYEIGDATEEAAGPIRMLRDSVARQVEVNSRVGEPSFRSDPGPRCYAGCGRTVAMAGYTCGPCAVKT